MPQRAGVRMRAKVAFAAVVVCVASVLSIPAGAQDSRPWKQGKGEAPTVTRLGYQINENTVGLISGNLNGTYLSIAHDMSAVLDNGNDFRVLPIIGKGGGQNIRDVRLLKGVDLGITQSVLLQYFKQTNELGPLEDKLVYIAKLFNEEMHFIVRSDSGITTPEQLNGKKVNFSDIGSGTQLSLHIFFERLGVKPVEVNMGQNDGFEALKRGDIAATILIAGKPTGSTRTLKSSEGFKILPVAYQKPLQDYFLPAVLTHEDYPTLIEQGQRIDTIAVGAVLFAYNWPVGTDRYNRLVKFVDQFFPRLADFQKAPRHPKWKEANLAATLPGWTRFGPAEEWLKKRVPSSDAERKQFEEYLGSQRGARAQAFAPEQRDQLFEEFLKWRQTRGR